MDQDIINNIYNMYPWASEDTMQKVNGNMQEQNIHMGTVAAVLSKKDAAAIKEMSRTTKQGKTKSKASGRAALKTLVIGMILPILKLKTPYLFRFLPKKFLIEFFLVNIWIEKFYQQMIFPK